MSNIFPKEVEKALSEMDKAVVKAPEFENGLTLQFKAVEKVRGKFGASEESSIVEKGILEEGEQFLYTFQDADGFTRKHYSTSFPLVIAMQQAEINFDDWILIKRTGKAAETRYTVEKVDAPDHKEIPF